MDERLKLSRRRFLVGAAGVAAGAVLSSCAPQPTAAPAAAPKEEAPAATKAPEPTAAPKAVEAATVRFGCYSNPSWDKVMEKTFTDFQAKFPNIKVSPEWSPYDQWVQKLQTMIAAGTLPDMVIIDWDEYYDRIAAKVQLPLDDLIARDKVAVDNWYPGPLEQFKIDGKLWSLPLGVLSIVTFYHLDAFKAAGIPVPDDTWTWDNVYDAAKKLTKTDSKGNTEFWGMLAPTWIGGEGQAAIMSAGGTGFVNTEYTKAAINEPIAVTVMERAVQALKDKIAPAAQDIQGIGDPFDAGKIGIAVQPSWNIYWHRNIEKFKYDMTYLVKDAKTGKRISPIYFGGFGISAASPVKDQAWELCKFMVGPQEDNQTAKDLMAGYGCHFPVKWATKEDWFLRGAVQRPEHWKVIFDNLNYAVAVPRKWGFREWSGKAGQEFDAAITGESTVKEALDKANKAIQDVIDAGRPK